METSVSTVLQMVCRGVRGSGGVIQPMMASVGSKICCECSCHQEQSQENEESSQVLC